MKKFALITGASAGIGKEFANQLAASGWDLVLTARRAENLKQISEEIKQNHKTDIYIIPEDLSDMNAPQRIADYCHKNSLNISMLVNNAGYGVPGDFDKVQWQAHADMLQVMLTSVTQLSHLFFPQMKAQNYGRIINVASLAGFAPPTAGHTLYAAVKSFLIKFSHSLHLEAKEFGVHVCALCPGFTYTEFHDVNDTRSMVSKLPKNMWMSAQEVVKQGLIAVEKNQAVKINGIQNNIIAYISRALPDSWMRFIMKGKMQKFRKR
ncbi:MAG: SDR family oxidoreductase [Proteobacteria bacterium]|nr:SDR family oxidoreductase [Pseudomonadota bacterium]